MANAPEQIQNLIDKPLQDFRNGDTLYIVKMYNGYSYTYLCSFISYRGRTVKARIVEAITPYAKLKKGDIVTAVAKSCYLWGINPADSMFGLNRYPRCNWFKNITEPAG